MNAIQQWFKDGILHKTDGPAVEYPDGTKKWYFGGQLHRQDGPAVEWGTSGKKCWYRFGQLHRDDGPAVEYHDGSKEWYSYGKLHRVDGPAVDMKSGTQIYYIHDVMHRENGPAYISYIGTKKWYLHGELHREDGPAVEYSDQSYGCYDLPWPNASRIQWYRYGNPYLPGEISAIVSALSPLELPPYVVLWILEWARPEIMELNQPRLVEMIEGIRNSRDRIMLTR